MIRTLFEAVLDFSVFLGEDADLRPIWRDILDHLAPYPTGEAPNGTIFVDWDGAPLPPKGDGQMLGCIQIVYPASQVSSSSANRTEYATAKRLMDYIDSWHASSDADCIIFQISTRLNYNQTAMYPNFEWAMGSVRPGFQQLGNLFPNGLTQAQNAGGALQYVNELLVRSDEPFVRFFPGHFSSITPSQHGLPLSLDLDGSENTDANIANKNNRFQPNACNLTGLWYDSSSNGPHPEPFNIQQTGDNTFTIPLPNEWGCPVYMNRSEVDGTPALPAVPRLAGHPECGAAAPAVPAVPAHTQMEFLWPAHGQVNPFLVTPQAFPNELCLTGLRFPVQGHNAESKCHFRLYVHVLPTEAQCCRSGAVRTREGACTT